MSYRTVRKFCGPDGKGKICPIWKKKFAATTLCLPSRKKNHTRPLGAAAVAPIACAVIPDVSEAAVCLSVSSRRPETS